MDNERLKKFVKILNNSPFVPASQKWQFLSVKKLNNEGFDAEDITRGLQDLLALDIILLFRVGFPGREFYSSRRRDINHEKNSLKSSVLKIIKSLSSGYNSVKTLVFVLKNDKLNDFLNENVIASENISVVFDDDTATIKIDKLTVQLPPFTNEHLFCRAVFKYEPNEPIDWEVIYKEITGNNESRDPSKDKKMVSDTYSRINKRICKIAKLENFLKWEAKTIKRTC